MQRRELLRWLGALTLVAQPLLARSARAAELPPEVAGVRLPRTPLAQGAAVFARTQCPDYLFNHSLRTFVFGALLLRRERLAYREQDAFVAALFHDLGLLPAFATPKGPFELDGANAAERWARDHGDSPAQVDRIWLAIALHDNYGAMARHTGPEAMLVSLGAGADVDGPGPGELEPRQIEEVLAAFPRLNFKKRFTELLVAHCERKPDAQGGTWLEGLCRAHGAHLPPPDAVEREIAAASFAE